MSLFRILALCLFISVTLSGCGFSPLYSSSDYRPVTNKFKDIEISNIPNRNGQFLRNLLLDNLYSSSKISNTPKYRLDIKSLKESVVNLGIQKDATATRAQMRIQLVMMLVDIKTNEPYIIFQRKLHSVNSFNILDSQYATGVSKQNVRDQSLKDLSDQIVRELSLYFKNPKRKNEK